MDDVDDKMRLKTLLQQADGLDPVAHDLVLESIVSIRQKRRRRKITLSVAAGLLCLTLGIQLSGWLDDRSTPRLVADSSGDHPRLLVPQTDSRKNGLVELEKLQADAFELDLLLARFDVVQARFSDWKRGKQKSRFLKLKRQLSRSVIAPDLVELGL